MAKEDMLKTMRTAGLLLCAVGAVAVLPGCATDNPFVQVTVYDSRPTGTAAAARDPQVEQMQANGGAAMVDRNGNVLRGNPQTDSGPLTRYADSPVSNTSDGYNVRYHAVPQTSLTMATLIKGNSVGACYPGDQVYSANTKPNATISINAEKTTCLHVGGGNQAVTYAPIPLPVTQQLLAGANPWTAAENGATQYVTNSYQQGRDQRYGYMERLPTAITARDGRIVPNGFPVQVVQGGSGFGFHKIELQGFSFSPLRPGAVPTGGVVPLQAVNR